MISQLQLPRESTGLAIMTFICSCISKRYSHCVRITDSGYYAILLLLVKYCGFADPIFPSLIFNKKSGGHNILWSAIFLMF